MTSGFSRGDVTLCLDFANTRSISVIKSQKDLCASRCCSAMICQFVKLFTAVNTISSEENRKEINDSQKPVLLVFCKISTTKSLVATAVGSTFIEGAVPSTMLVVPASTYVFDKLKTPMAELSKRFGIMSQLYLD